MFRIDFGWGLPSHAQDLKEEKKETLETKDDHESYAQV